MAVARVTSPRGVRGELACDVITDFPDRLRRLPRVYVGDPPQPRGVERALVREGRLLLKLAGVDSRDDAEALRRAWVMVPEAEAAPLPDGHFYWHQLLGLRVVDLDGAELGTIADILETGSNDVYVVATRRGELLIPAIGEVVRSIDLAAGTMTVELMPGLGPD